MTGNERSLPGRGAIATIVALILGLISSVPIFFVWRQSLEPTEQAFLGEYAKSYALSSLPSIKPAGYSMTILDAQRRPVKVRSAAIYGYLRTNVFAGVTLPDLAKTPLIVWGASLFVGLLVGASLDGLRLRGFRAGKRLRGPEILTPRQFAKTVEGDGFVLELNK